MPNVILSLLGTMSSNTALKILLVVLIILVVLISALALVFIIALRKRAPVVKVIMAPPTVAELKQTVSEKENNEETEKENEQKPESEPETEAEEDEVDSDKDDDDEESVSFVTEGEERVRYDRSLNAKLIQLKNESKEWYSQLKNELLHYEKVRCRMSWKRESFRIGRVTFARIIVRGRTLCLLLAVDPSGFVGTKFSVENVGNVASMSDTPCLYRIKSGRRIKYAKELITAVMTELGVKKQSNYEAQDFYMPYIGDMSLMEKGLIKRVVYGSTRTFEIRETNRVAAACTTNSMNIAESECQN